MTSERAQVLARAATLRRAGQSDDAWRLLSPWIPAGDADVLEEAARVAESLGMKARALTLLESVTVRHPSRASSWVNLAALRAELQDARGAVSAARAATRLAPDLVAGWINLGSASASLRDYESAIYAFQEAHKRAPGDPEITVDLAAAEFSAGEVAVAARRLQALLAGQPAHAAARSLLLLILHHATNDPVGLSRAHKQFASSLGILDATPLSLLRPPHQPLRVGFLSGDFRQHSVWFFLRPILSGLERHQIALYCIYTDSGEDEVTAQWRAHAHCFVDAAGLSDDALEAKVRELDLDILISLGGHTTAARPTFFLRRVVATQMSFLGYPGLIGSPNVDWWIADSAVVTSEECQAQALGQVALLPDSYFCYSPGETPAPVTLLDSRQPVTFGSFNILAKVSAVTVRLWADVLRAVPDSRLILKTDSVRGPTARRITAEFAGLGIEAERLLWQDWCADRDEHLTRYGNVDIALDTFPYNGATTTCEALWMGVPVLSLAGKTPASRMGRSILRAAGKSAWCVEDHGAFIELARKLASDVTTWRANRHLLRSQVASSPLCDEESYVRDFAGLMHSLVKR